MRLQVPSVDRGDDGVDVLGHVGAGIVRRRYARSRNGDREDVQRLSIEAGVRALIVTNGTVVPKAIRELAEKGVSQARENYEKFKDVKVLEARLKEKNQ